MMDPLLTGIDCALPTAERAEATVQADRDMIFGAIEQGSGFADSNRTIRRALRESLQRVIIANLE